MFIVSKDREIVVNTDNITNIYIANGNKIMAHMVDSEEIMLGIYVKGAKAVFEEMLKNVFPPDTLIFKNCTPDKESMQDFLTKRNLGAVFVNDHTDNVETKMYGCGVYYMPEE